MIVIPFISISIASNYYLLLLLTVLLFDCCCQINHPKSACEGRQRQRGKKNFTLDHTESRVPLEKAFDLVFVQQNLLTAYLCKTLSLSLHKACSPLCAAQKRKRGFLANLNSRGDVHSSMRQKQLSDLFCLKVCCHADHLQL